MHHSFVDRYSDLDSAIHRLDPRVKITGSVALLVSVALTPPGRPELFAGWSCVLGGIIALSLVPAGYILRRALMVVPFSLMVAAGLPFFREGETVGSITAGPLSIGVTDNGLIMFATVMAKSYLATVTLVSLAATTRFASLLGGFRALGGPKLLVMILSFMYRYLFVLVEEVELIDRARKSRSPSGSGLRQVRVLANVVGILFLRTYERAERVYQSMLSRGYRGETSSGRRGKFAKADWGAGLILAAAISMVWGFA